MTAPAGPPYLQTLTLLSHVQNVCDECGFTRPSSLFGGTSSDQRQYIAVAQRAIAKLRGESSWPELQKEHTFSIVSGTAAYALPSDHESFLDETVWNRTDYERARGPLTAQEWQHEKSSNVSVSIDDQWRVKGATSTQFHITPTPSATATVVTEYSSRHAVLDNDGATTKERFSEDTDRVLLNYNLFELALKWMLRKEKKLDYADHKAEYDEELAKAKGALTGSRPISMNSKEPRPRRYPDTGWGA